MSKITFTYNAAAIVVSLVIFIMLVTESLVIENDLYDTIFKFALGGLFGSAGQTLICNYQSIEEDIKKEQSIKNNSLGNHKSDK